jgi:hypothetical protein
VEGRKEEPGIIAPQRVIIIARVIKMDANEDLSLNDRRKKILDKYYGIVKLDRVVSLEEILELGDDSLRY